MKTMVEWREYVKRIEWRNRYVSSAGVVPSNLAWELVEAIADLTEKVHKSQGMANEINILTAENRRLRKESKEVLRVLGSTALPEGG